MIADFDLSGSESDDLSIEVRLDTKQQVASRGRTERPQRTCSLCFWSRLRPGEKRKLTDPPSRFSDKDPAISPDGRTLVFCRRLRSGAS